jgi:hypothetical protein
VALVSEVKRIVLFCPNDRRGVTFAEFVHVLASMRPDDVTPEYAAQAWGKFPLVDASE